MEYLKNKSKSTCMISYLFFFSLLLQCVSNTEMKWDFNKGGQDWPDSCKTGDQAPIDISKPFEYKSNLISYKDLFLRKL